MIRHILTVYITCPWGCGQFDPRIGKCPGCSRPVYQPRA